MEGEIGRILSKREGKEKKYMRSSQIPKSFPKIAQDVTPQSLRNYREFRR